MANSTSADSTTLHITRTFKAPREKVFEAWTNPEALKRWFGPSDDFSTPGAEVDLQVGGHFRIQMKAPNGEEHTVGGVYREIQVPEKLVFTWSWEAGGGCGGSEMDEPIETLVTVEFSERGNETEVILTHECFANADQRDKHNEGWSGCLARLGKAV
ncbi:MAG: SRPBCC domain-containing protein [Nitrospirae bacterium]|nr:SRPBCC domain-containing protein [Nitrospirota bacterium]